MENVATTGAVQGLDNASKGYSSQGLIVQGYCNSVLQQASVNLHSTPKLKTLETGINDGLVIAKGHADDYLANIQPLILDSVADMSNYFKVYNSIATVLAKNTNEDAWIRSLNQMKDQSTQYETNAKSIVNKLIVLNSNLGVDSSAFARMVSDLNVAADGDDGILKSIDGQLGTLQGQIDGCIAGMALSGLAVIGGAIMIGIGAISEIFTGGAATALILGGVAVVAAGVGGEAGSAITFQTLNNQKNDLLVQQSSLSNEVKLALGLSIGYNGINSQARAAMSAATQMSNAWGLLKGELGNLVSNLEDGITSTDIMREIFLTAANLTIPDVKRGIDNINSQMSGTQVLIAPQGQRIGDFAVSLANGYKLAA
ncbi:HBL/NHE enterotoxin family protein [Spirosoma fluviale]|uniref:Haemolytic enterotoxin (HBL) n=1 Tax=Spirosoma fluviale TaxID=1597977 RepID=A0A286GRX4_9BACT|nr:HBL/NHE enterotoxin family protein [Spirosoma fluviale]SOD97809.1 haemolytic enterotoxin (HBL) [Spirosoma fluviale]